MGPIDRANLWLRTQAAEREYLCLFGPAEYVPPEDGYRIQSPERSVLNERQDDGHCPEL
jgi:hypothetical protein